MNNIRKFLDERGIKYSHVAEGAQIDKQLFYSYVSERCNPGIGNAIRILNCLRQYDSELRIEDLFESEPGIRCE